MFDIGLQEILLIGVLALLVFGPSKLPDLGRMVGRAMREFRRASDEFRSTVETNLHINDPDGPSVSSYATETSTITEVAPVEVPAAPTAGAAPSEPPLEGTASTEPFCAQSSSRLFHRRDCAWVKRIPETERVYFKQLSDAHDRGLQACPVCEPM